jgi:hypothetical protein
MNETTPATEGTSSVRNTRSKKVVAMSLEAKLLTEISDKLDRVTAILAAQGKPTDDQIDILSAVGCDSGFIAAVVGMEPGAVRTRRSRKRAKSGKSETDASVEVEART